MKRSDSTATNKIEWKQVAGGSDCNILVRHAWGWGTSETRCLLTVVKACKCDSESDVTGNLLWRGEGEIQFHYTYYRRIKLSCRNVIQLHQSSSRRYKMFSYSAPGGKISGLIYSTLSTFWSRVKSFYVCWVCRSEEERLDSQHVHRYDWKSFCCGLSSVNLNNLPSSNSFSVFCKHFPQTFLQCVIRADFTVKNRHLGIVETSAAIKSWGSH